MFLSAESSPTTIREAFAAGALGYVLKSQSVGELLPALKSIASGKRFLSAGIGRLKFACSDL
jgi:DNA-binding NarL/FixJ family response regulator